MYASLSVFVNLEHILEEPVVRIKTIPLDSSKATKKNLNILVVRPSLIVERGPAEESLASRPSSSIGLSLESQT